MLSNRKVDPIWVVKGCMLILIAAFAFSAVSMAFGPRAAAQTASSVAADELPSFRNMAGIIPNSSNLPQVNFVSFVQNIARTTGIYGFINNMTNGVTPAGQPITIFGWQELLMVIVGFVVVYLGAVKGFEPILLVPIGFGIIFVNIPGAGMGDPGIWNEELHIFEHQGFLNIIYNAGVGNEFFPLIIFIGIGAMTDFGPLIANPKTALLGAAAQFGVFATLFFISIANFLPGVAFNLKEACAVAIIGGADGPTTIYIAAKLAPHLLATVAVAAYSYMALVPPIQPPIMRALTTKKERLIRMRQLRPVSRTEKIAFPMVVFT
ncbi:MAG: sodium ion-translocating decarboxylase subunit beta, partial [Spirochaetaceae bacterium]|nr:sodium ion-translocating decarboxylase subunit beta [Spirochaetaceae bacterium]